MSSCVTTQMVFKFNGTFKSFLKPIWITVENYTIFVCFDYHAWRPQCHTNRQELSRFSSLSCLKRVMVVFVHSLISFFYFTDCVDVLRQMWLPFSFS